MVLKGLAGGELGSFRPDFDERHWQRMSFVPMSRGVVTIVSERVERDVSQDKWGTHVTIVL
jgi:hypothetical protein